jgi:cytochrome b6-f complex iron-sulfur subunit
MTTTNLILIGVGAVALLGALGVFAVAFRRVEGDWSDRVERDARRADRSAIPPVAAPAPPAAEPEPAPPAEEPEPSPPAEEPVAVAVVEAQRVVELSAEEAGVTRRQFFNRALGATFGVWSAGLGLGFLAFFWPRVTGGFGADINAGPVPDILGQVRAPDGSVVPMFVPEARAYVVPAPRTLSAQYAGRNVEAGGLMAIYQRCVHLGCRVPWCASSQGFECPCHGSKYNEIGEYFAGPAPRNLDVFVVDVNDSGEFIIRTSVIIETARAPSLSVDYPRGPSCI